MADKKIYVDHDLKDNVAIGFGATTPTYSTARLQVKGSGSTSATKLLYLKNSLNSSLVQLNDAGNAVIGNAAPLTSARLYTHAVNTALVYGIFNDLNSTTATGFGVYCRAQNTTNSYNYFQARGTAGISRALWSVAEGIGSTQNFGSYNNSRNGSQLSVASYNTIPSGTVAASQYTAGSYNLNNDSLSLVKYGSFTQLSNGVTGGTSYGHRVTIGTGTSSINTTNYIFHGKLDSLVTQTGSKNVGLYLDLQNGGGAGSTSRAIETVGGDIKFGDLAGTSTRFVQADATGVLSAKDIPTFPVYTVATAPAAATYTNGVIIVSDEVGGRTLATSDGTNWRRISDGATIA